MNRTHLFQHASTTSQGFFHRSLGANRRRLEQLSERRKPAVKMTSLTDEQIVEFFIKEKLREERKNSFSGEVPDIFRTNTFFVHVEGDNWIHQRDWKEASVFARVYVKDCGSEEFSHILRTETIAEECSPRFITRVPFDPLIVRNSQNKAMSTILRVDTYVRDKRFASIHVSLAQLLWDLTYETIVEPYCPSFLIHRGKKACTVKLTVSRGHSKVDHDDGDECEIDFKVQVSRKVWRLAQDSKLFVAICSVAGYGQWTRSYLSEFLEKPTKNVENGNFLVFKLSRGDLTCHNHKNPIRIELRGSRKGIPILYGFVQFALPSDSTRSYLPWNQARCSRLSASAALDVNVCSPEHAVLSLHIGTSDDEVKTFINAETGGARREGHEKSRRDGMVCTRHKHSYDSYGSSSESCESYPGCSWTEDNKKVVLSKPKYCVTFPSPL